MPTAMNKKKEIALQTRKNLREAFWNLYTEKPIEKITIKEVTDLAGYNRGTFYLYYKDIYDILSVIEKEMIEIIEAFANRWMKEDISEQWPYYVEELVEWIRVYAPYASVLLSDHGDPAFTRELKRILRPAIERWAVTPKHLSEREAAVLTEYHLAGTISALSAWLSQEEQIPFQDFIGFMMKYFFPAL